MQKRYSKQDVDPSVLQGKTIAVIGYGAQGRAQSRLLAAAGLSVLVGVRKGGPSWEQALADDMRVTTIEDASDQADIIHILLPDEIHGVVYKNAIEPYIKPGNVLSFSHGFSIVHGQITPPEGVGVIMVAPKGPGTQLYTLTMKGSGLPALISLYASPNGNEKAIALGIADAIGCTRIGVFECTFAEETNEDLFGEQAVLCGGATELVKAGFETLTEAGYPPEVAYFECLHELKLVVDLLYKGGLGYMWDVVSNTAEYGGLTRGKRVLGPDVKARMKAILYEIESGQFADEWVKEAQSGMQHMQAMREQEKAHPIEAVGKQIRALFDEN